MIGGTTNIKSQQKAYVSWDQVPQFWKTKKQLLKQHRRLKKDADAAGTITMIFDASRGRLRGVNAVSSTECEQIRQELRTKGYSLDLGRLDAAGQLAVCNLYHINDSQEINSFRETEARELLGYWLWDGSHPDHYITERPG